MASQSQLSGMGLLEVERRRRGLSATDLAESMGVSASAVTHVERGTRPASASFRTNVAKALGLRVQDLFPTWFIVCEAQNGALRVIASDGRPLAWTSEKEATAYAKKRNLAVRGPLGPDFFASLLRVSADQVRGQLVLSSQEEPP